MLCVSAFALTQLLFSLSIRTDAFKHAYRSVSFPKETRVRDLLFSIESSSPLNLASIRISSTSPTSHINTLRNFPCYKSPSFQFEYYT